MHELWLESILKKNKDVATIGCAYGLIRADGSQGYRLKSDLYIYEIIGYQQNAED